jgi:hypothetical protein
MTTESAAEGEQTTRELGEPPTAEFARLSAAPAPPDGLQPAAQPLVATGTSDTCVACGAQMLPDQHYCLVCGERRGKPRFTMPTGVAAAPQAAPSRRADPAQHRMSPNGSLIALIATLILAMGVGVVIGHFSATSGAPHSGGGSTVILGSGAAAAGAGAAASAARSGTTASGSGSSSASHAGGKSSSKKVPKVNTTTVAAPPAAVSHGAQISGHGASNLPPATVQPGQHCSNGQAGCQNGQAVGAYFGGG